MDGLVPVVAVLFFVVIIGFFIYVFVRDQKTKNDLRTRGIRVTGKVTDRTHEVERNTDSKTNTTTTTDVYYISYQYVVKESPYSRRDSVNEAVYETLHEGQAVEVVYLPENPYEARLSSELSM